ncbi:hypothetical protein SAMN05421692_0712 [Chryseobacterium indologenes]|nr:hypothetical protein SAMN05421692_0712 [Chryseobacterium indologenes]SUX50086.1 Uncharacterised protein [Chryseobacterium indologenes]VFA40969.1 Uncharacterised protein [Chryseobacterium indologenes]
MNWDLIFFVSTLAIFAAISYLIMRLCRRWTENSRYKHLLNFLILIISFSVIMGIAFIMVVANLSFQR